MSSGQAGENHSDLDTAEYWLSTLGDAQPTFATLPTPGAPNELAAIELVAAMLKTPLLPWQRFVARVITEKLPDGSYRFPTVLLTVPRQSGKTTLFRAVLAARCLKKPNRRSFLSAQSGKDARERLFDLADMVSLSAIGSTVTIRRAAEAPQIIFSNKSRLRSFAPTAESLHGFTLSDVLLDEIFSFSELEGNLLLGAVTPAMSTITDKQLLMCSTMGTAESVFLNQQIKTGRESTHSAKSQVAYFEWALPEGADPMEPDNWIFHPGLAAGLIKTADIQSASETMSRGEFVRAYMNRLTLNSEALFDLNKWISGKQQLSIPQRSQVAVGFEVSVDRSRSAIVAAWKDGKNYQVKLLRNGHGTQWLPDALDRISEGRPLAIGADKHPQNSVIITELEAESSGAVIQTLTTDSYKTGCVAFKARIEDGQIQHNGHLGLQGAVAGAQSRPMGESWVVSHRSDPEVIAAIVACRLLDEVKQEQEPILEVWG